MLAKIAFNLDAYPVNHFDKQISNDAFNRFVEDMLNKALLSNESTPAVREIARANAAKNFYKLNETLCEEQSL